ncbi:hypothetical protein [Microbulbifer sp. VAAF005]|uniref:hypothetical protein n=1 Tax=Microbulbifer sp. VAAF005 TaxID=3034230 RepID=UPI0024ADB781|nr:hypothetical protein [Microbulbifer sp. VAAF005]WHI47601.1 hypothetical protein P0078_04215 [Microbulbifer sp. VAAF005]
MTDARHCGKLRENYALYSAVKYHDIFQSIEAGNIDEAKEKLLTFQAAEVLVLEGLRKKSSLINLSWQLH